MAILMNSKEGVELVRGAIDWFDLRDVCCVSIERGLLAGDYHVFSTDCCRYLMVISFKVFVLDGERQICPVIEFVSRWPEAYCGGGLGDFLSELIEIVPEFGERHVVYCVPLTSGHARMYRRLGFVAVEGVDSDRPMLVLDLRSI